MCKFYVYLNPKAPQHIKDFVAEHFSDGTRLSIQRLFAPRLYPTRKEACPSTDTSQNSRAIIGAAL
jgi:hypothetical protein